MSLRLWIKIFAGLAAIVLMAALIVALGRMLMATLNVIHTDGGAVEPDPMFAREEPVATRPPELDGTDGEIYLHTDNSANWQGDNQTPVDKTAEELAREAADQMK